MCALEPNDNKIQQGAGGTVFVFVFDVIGNGASDIRITDVKDDMKNWSIQNGEVISLVKDCNGDIAGTAVIDNCGECIGGETGKTACVKDCFEVNIRNKTDVPSKEAELPEKSAC